MRSWYLVLLLILVSGPACVFGADSDSAAFATVARPLIQRYCLECHSTEEQEGEVDLERFTRFDQVQNAADVWQRVAEQIATGAMPPREATQPTAAERAPFDRWLREFLTAEATRRAGDPGRVVLRRLDNAEYAWTIRDLTGLDTLDPAREFPVDGAAGEGFTNTGQALVMSPALVTKYLDAAKGVAAHAVLTPDGFRFAPGTSPRDWTEELLDQIRAFYARFTAEGQGGSSVNLQGIIFATNAGGRLPVERYLAATIDEKAKLTSGARRVDDVARDRGLNARYLATLWQALHDPAPSLLLKQIQTRWQVATAADVPQLTAEVVAWQQALWQFGSVGHIGKLNGPKAWMTPVEQVTTEQTIRFTLPAATDGQGVTVSLVATDAGDGPQDDCVVWHNPRLVQPGRPDLPLRDLGQHVDRFGASPTDLAIAAPSVVSFTVPPELADKAELVVTARLAADAGTEASVQVAVLPGTPGIAPGLHAGDPTVTLTAGPWTSANRQTASSMPILTREGSAGRQRIELALADFRALFPPALCYSKIVPVDEVVTLTLFYREDDHLARLMLDDAQKAHLDRLWTELHFVSRDALTLVDAFGQLLEYASQDADPKVFEPLRQPILDRATAYRQALVDAEPKQVDALVRFAAQAYRRPLTEGEATQLRSLYTRLRSEEIPHEEAFRLTLARIFVAPAFLYRLEQPGAGAGSGPITNHEQATRLSYFLWSSLPDAELRGLADAGRA